MDFGSKPTQLYDFIIVINVLPTINILFITPAFLNQKHVRRYEEYVKKKCYGRKN